MFMQPLDVVKGNLDDVAQPYTTLSNLETTSSSSLIVATWFQG